MSVRRQPRRTGVPSQRGTVLRLPPPPTAPDPSDLSAVRAVGAASPRPRAIDLFCGAGGLSLGLRDAGFSVLVGADANEWAVETHTANLGGLGYVGDLSDPGELLEQLDGWGIDHVELVAGGVPCQPFSRAGQAKIRELIRSGERHRRTRGRCCGARSCRSSNGCGPRPCSSRTSRISRPGTTAPCSQGSWRSLGDTRLHGGRADPRLLPVRRTAASVAPAPDAGCAEGGG